MLFVAIFDTLLYQLTESLHILGNVKKIKAAKEDSKSACLV